MLAFASQEKEHFKMLMQKNAELVLKLGDLQHKMQVLIWDLCKSPEIELFHCEYAQLQVRSSVGW